MFRAIKTGFITPPPLLAVFLLSIPVWFHCYSSSLFVRRWFHMWSLFVPYLAFLWCTGSAVFRDVLFHLYFWHGQFMYFQFCVCSLLSRMSPFRINWSDTFIVNTVKTNDVQHEKKALMPLVNSDGPVEHVHPCSLIWTFSVRRHILQYPLIL